MITEEVTHESISKKIRKFVQKSQQNFSFFITSDSVKFDTKLSIGGDCNADSLCQAFAQVLDSKPELVPVIFQALKLHQAHVNAIQDSSIDENQLSIF
jgi:hypothetical protein